MEVKKLGTCRGDSEYERMGQKISSTEANERSNRYLSQRKR